jgi:glycolate oxidase FAD binding subunit
LPSVSSLGEAGAVFRQASASGARVSIEREGGDVVLSTSGLDRVLEHEAGDLTATVEAGIRLSALNAYLAEHGQMLALDPPGDPTIGACLAADLSGPGRHRYGTPRDLVLGVTLVLADGTVAHSGGKVVKNVAGYDLGKLFCGSRGTLGLIARASFRLHPRPAVTRTVVARVAAEEVARAGQAIHRSTLEPGAVDFLPGRLGLRFEGGARAVDAQVEAARSLLHAEEAEGEAFWAEAGERQLAARGVVGGRPWELPDADGLAVVRLGAGVGYTEQAVPAPRPHPLVERLRREFDPRGVLA